ncbi:MAG TPA: hypothetical protein VFP09_11520 [Desertimonas sp.]|nr:hypothetical protein [Desertimonas sp.]
MSSTDRQIAGAAKEGIVQGYVARQGDRYYAVIYEGIDPLTGRERRRWHPAGTDQAVAETLACDLAARHRRGGGHERASLTVAVYLTQRWLPSKKMVLRASTWDAYRRVIDLHLVPRVGGSRCGSCVPITSSACTPTSSTTDAPTPREDSATRPS